MAIKAKPKRTAKTSKTAETKNESAEKAGNSGKALAIIAHILGLFTSFVGSLIIYLVAEDSFAKENAKEALNWQISMIIYVIISAILIIVLIGIALLVILGILNLVFCIYAAIKASDNVTWKYPLSIRFIN
jgi:uncharacterized protein